MVFPCFSLRFVEELRRVNDLRHLPEKRMACALQIAKQGNYSPKRLIQTSHAGLEDTQLRGNLPINMGDSQRVFTIRAWQANP